MCHVGKIDDSLDFRVPVRGEFKGFASGEANQWRKQTRVCYVEKLPLEASIDVPHEVHLEVFNYTL